MQGVPPRKGRAPQDGRVSLCMWEVTGGLGPGGAGGAEVVPPSCWAPEGGRGERARSGPGSAAPPAAAGAAVAWHPCCCHGNNGGANLLMSPPQLRITILQWLIGPSQRLLSSQGWGPGTRWAHRPAVHPSSPCPLSSAGLRPRLPAPPPASFPLHAVGTPSRPSGSVRTGGQGPAGWPQGQQRPPPPPHLPPWEEALPMVSPPHGLLVGASGCEGKLGVALESPQGRRGLT